MRKVTVCPECEGRGTIPEEKCDNCKGEGRVHQQQEFEFVIPAGVESGQVLHFEGKGHAGKKEARPGDLYVKISIKKHPEFERDQDDLYTTREISISKAVLGGPIEIKTLEDKQTVKVPQGSRTGDVLKVDGQGLPRFSGFGRGDLHVELKVDIPDELTPEQKKLVEELKEKGL